MSDTDDMKRQMQAIYAKSNMLIRKFKKCSDNVKSVLFKTHCVNFYCCQLWSSFTKEVYKMVKVAYNNSFRHMFQLCRQEHVSPQFVSRNICTFDAAIRKAAFSLKSRVNNSHNKILSSIIESRFYILGSSLNAHWRKLLFKF